MVSKKSLRCVTTLMDSLMDEKETRTLFELLRDNVEWVQGVRSRQGPTRLAKIISPGDTDPIAEAVLEVTTQYVNEIGKQTGLSYALQSVYLNYYKDGEMWTPSHTHPGTHQMVISLGIERPLVVGRKSYSLKSGQAIIFGSASHGVPKVAGLKEPRISIATFMTPLDAEMLKNVLAETERID